VEFPVWLEANSNIDVRGLSKEGFRSKVAPVR
jgi:hypothetical protein